ncbi:hypothetical protein KBT16_33055 [Nostoc sp. CCCryo 231-06]|nr:hypothetical protein [Nostoc sp. CCCryo 231-06]
MAIQGKVFGYMASPNLCENVVAYAQRSSCPIKKRSPYLESLRSPS